jgi:predicted MPP superfamily phosphohydrolase
MENPRENHAEWHHSPLRVPMTRRRFLRRLTGGVVGGSLLAGCYAHFVELHWLDLVHRDLPVAGLPDDLVGRTLVQLSDLHIEPRVDELYIRRVFQRIASLAPDFVVITGDWISYHGSDPLARLDRALRDLPRGRLGTIGILGNHDYGERWTMTALADDVAAVAARHGVRLLRNEAATIGGIAFIGLDDFWSPRYAPADVLAEHSAKPGTIVLCHNPDVVDARAIWRGFSGWILAGHTHGGQCKPPFLPPPLLPVRNRRYTSGEFDVGEGRRLYINRGVGHLLAVRFNARPEATLFRLARAAG